MTTTTTHINSNAQAFASATRQKGYKKSDRLINYYLALYFAAGLIFASFYNTWLLGVFMGGLSLLIYYIVRAIKPTTNLYQYVLSGVLVVFGAQYIYQVKGLSEMYFFTLVGSVILIVYQNWKLQFSMFLFILLSQFILGYFLEEGLYKSYFNAAGNFSWQLFTIHLFLTVSILAVSGTWSYHLRRYTNSQIRKAVEMAEMQNSVHVAATEAQQRIALEESQRALEESNLRFIYSAQATSDAIFDRTYSENQIFWGDGFQVLFGYPIDKVTCNINFWASKVHPEDYPSIAGIINDAKDDPSAKTWSGEYRFLKNNGEYAHVREKAIILRDEKGKAARTIGALQDITDLRNNEMELKELNETLEKEKYFLDSLMNNMPDAIYFKDLESKFIRVSCHMATKFNTTIEEVIGKSDFDFHTKEKAALSFKDEQEIMSTGVPRIDIIEKSVQQKGADRWVSSTKMPLVNTRGELMGTFGISRDITEVKRLQEESHSAIIEKAVAQGKFEIASDVMHDIGNAVVGFGAYLTRIRRMQEKDNPDTLKKLAMFFDQQKVKIKEAIGEEKAGAVLKMLVSVALTQRSNHEEIDKAITEQFNIITHIQEILDIQRQYISGHKAQERKPVNMHTVVSDSLAMLFASIDKKGIEMTLDIPDNLPIIKGDRTKLTQVLLNIVRNSIEAIEKDSIRKNIAVTVSFTESELLVSVSDTGKGFDAVVGDQLFNKAFTTKSTANGMGLYGCKTILDTHEAIFSIYSEGLGKGALAEIRFPVDRTIEHKE